MDLRFQIQLWSRIAVLMLHYSYVAQGSTQDFLTGGPSKFLPRHLTVFVYEKIWSLALAIFAQALKGTTSLGFIKKNIEIQIKQSLRLPLK